MELGYKDPSNVFILLKNLASISVNECIIDKKLLENLKNYRVEKIIAPNPLFTSFLLGLISKYNRAKRSIYYLSHLVNYSINNHIPNKVGEWKYSQFQDVLQMLIHVGGNCTMVK